MSNTISVPRKKYEKKEILMMCPECKKSMLLLEYGGIEVDYCPDCAGCWLDEGELELLMGTRDQALGLLDWSGGKKGERICPCPWRTGCGYLSLGVWTLV